MVWCKELTTSLFLLWKAAIYGKFFLLLHMPQYSQRLVDEHSGCFQALFTHKKSVTVIIYSYIHTSAFISLVKFLMGRTAESKYMCVFFISTDNARLLFEKVVVTHIPPTMYEYCLFFTSSPAFVISCLFDNNHSNRYEVLSYCGSYFHFPED